MFTRIFIVALVLESALGVYRCPSGWLDYSKGDVCFLTVDTPKTYYEARTSCQALEGDLAIVDSQAVTNFINSNVDTSRTYYIGLTDLASENTWLWGDGSLLGYSDWNGGEPNDYGSGEDCVTLTGNGGKWNDVRCDSVLKYLCQRSKDVPIKCDEGDGWVSMNEKCYKTKTTTADWATAEERCRDHGGAEIISINSQIEQDYVNSVIAKRGNPLWIGLSDTQYGQVGEYYWSTGDKLENGDYANWNPNEPESRYTENCVEILETSSNGKWTVAACGASREYICEKEEGVCPTGWKIFKGQCYQYNYAYYKATWTDAKNLCEQQGAYLVVINNKAEDDFLAEEYADLSAGGIGAIWFGISDTVVDGNFQWVAGSSATYRNWNSGQPTNTAGQDDCGIIYTDSYLAQWDTSNCYTLQAFVCEINAESQVFPIPINNPTGGCQSSEWEMFGDRCYYVDTQARTWQDARTNCQSMGAELASIGDGDEQSFITQRCDNVRQKMWVGLNDIDTEGVYVWVDGTPFSFTNWFPPGDPQNNARDCVIINQDQRTLGEWRDRDCTETWYSICETPRNIFGTVAIPTQGPTPIYDPRCGRGWDWNPELEACYKVVWDGDLSWQDSYQECRGQGGDLLSINSREEQTYISGRLYGVNAALLWIGANDMSVEGGWGWSDGSPFKYMNWDSGEPNDYDHGGTGEDCSELIVETGFWNDERCERTHGYICKNKGILTENYNVYHDKYIDGYDNVQINNVFPDECAQRCIDEKSFICRSFDYQRSTQSCLLSDKTQSSAGGLSSSFGIDTYDYYELVVGYFCPQGFVEYNGNCYGFMSSEVSWHEAQTSCQSLGTDLVIVNTQDINDFITSQVDVSVRYFIGLHDLSNEGNFEWVDGSPLGWSNWDTNEPNNAGSGEDCVELWKSGTWNDRPCDYATRYICQGAKGYYTPVEPGLPAGSRCPDGWSPYRDYCYLMHTEEDSWANTRDACRQYSGADLASIWDENENLFVLSFIQSVCEAFHTDGTDTNYNYRYNTDAVTTTRVTFDVMASNDVHIALTEQQQDSDQMYEIVIGGWGNTQSVIRRSMQGENKVVAATVDFLSPVEWRSFWVTWDNGLISVGKYGESAFMSWQDPNPLTVNYVGYTTGWGSEGEFRICIDHEGDNHAWIGLNDLDVQMSFEWSDGSEVTYTNWYDQEPNNYNGNNEDCTNLYIDGNGAGYWNDAKCNSNNYKGVCKTKKQVLPPTEAPSDSDCETGWTAYHTSCYKFVTTAKSWSDSGTGCHDWGAHLVSVGDMYEQAFLSSILGSADGDAYWCGLNDRSNPGTYEWEHGEGVTYSYWDRNQPDDSNGQCVTMKTGTGAGLWDDQICDQPFPYVCEKLRPNFTPPPIFTDLYTTLPSDAGCVNGWIGYGSNCFQVNDFVINGHKPTWSEARAKCVSIGAELASFHSEAEDRYITGNSGIRGSGGFWIGLNDLDLENGFVWSDLSAVNYVGWEDGEPNDVNGEDCVEMFFSGRGWNDIGCDVERGYVCKIPKGQKLLTTPVPPIPTQSAECLALGDGWEHYSGSCYYFSSGSGDEREGWADARDWCTAKGVALASIHGEDENNYILARIKTLFLSTEYWIGLREDGISGIYKWADGTPLDYTKWNDNQPDDHYGQEQCATIYTNTGNWNDKNCGDSIPFVCKKVINSEPPPQLVTGSPDGNCRDGWVEHSNQCYQFNGDAEEDRLNWNDARDNCRSSGGDLATIHGQELQFYLVTKLRDRPRNMWIGLSDIALQRKFRWTDGSPVDYTNWNSGEPNGRNDEDCVEMLHFEAVAGKWNDLGCQNEMGYFCQANKDINAPEQVPEEDDCTKDGYVQDGDGCYRVLTDQVRSFSEALAACQDDGTSLASIKNAYDNAYVSMLAQDYGRSLWLGMADSKTSGVYEWVDNYPVWYTYWGENEPSKGAGEGCVRIETDGTWNDFLCADTTYAICKYYLTPFPTTPVPPTGMTCPDGWAAYDSSCYNFDYINNQESWPTARFTCEGLDSQLVSIHSSGQNSFLSRNIIGGNKNLWIGLTRTETGGYSWVDNSPVQYTNWAQGEPTLVHDGDPEDCVEMYNIDSARGTWNDLSCYGEKGFICQTDMIYNGTDTGPENPGDPGSQTGGSNKLSAGAVVGICVGIIALIVIVAGAVFVYQQKPASSGAMSGITSPPLGFDNALYGSKDKDGATSVNVSMPE